MKVLVLGRRGQLAHALAEAGACAGDVMTLAGRDECDIRNPVSIQVTLDQVRPDVLVNTAAYTAVDRAESEASEAIAVNATGAANVAQVCERAGIPLIHVSTDYVFDGCKTSPYLEEDVPAPLNVYGRSKLQGEQEVANAAGRHVILRTAWVHSPWGNNFVKTMLRLAASRDAVTVVDDLRGCPTFAPHLADAILRIAEAITRNGGNQNLFGIYHAAGHGETTPYELAGQIFSYAAKHGIDPPPMKAIAGTEYPTPARRPANSRLDCSKLEHVFGIRLPDWQTGVADCVTRIFAVPDGRGI